MPMFPKIVDTLSLSMKAANLRNQVITNNIANVNVPGFRGSDVVFEQHLRQALESTSKPGEETGLRGITTHPLHIPIPPIDEVAASTAPEPQIVPREGDLMRQDGNNVDMEEQMAKMAANQLWYQSLVRSVSDEFTRLRTAITEGRR